MIINSLFFFATGYIVKVSMIVNEKKSADESLQERARKGEYLPIIMQFDLNERGGYTAAIYNMRGVHLVKEKHDVFLLVLKDILEAERLRPVSKPEFKLLSFEKDS
jgi:hypothetical protein